MIDEISISGGKPAMAVPLIFIVLLSMAKDFYEDYKKGQQDWLENNREVLCYDGKQGWEKKKWQDIRVGNII